ncbi:Plastid transcriptionally active isoform 1 [Senna tora]|uniref:Plastid transcriptionally active isoform 1 n=1 Tax=Senna tora TaxID=362788 RepID=A0A834XHM9_9FABA|nr:Plastid transcriptionally active isoform 1 [Senna tora]
MKQGLLPLNPCFHSLSPPSLPSFSFAFPQTRRFKLSISATLDSIDTQQELTARERRRLRNERRETKTTTNWREEVEERLIKKPKKKKGSWTDELNLDNLAKLGPQWWVVRGSRVRALDTAQLLARSLARNFPDIEFKLYAPAVHVKRKLKNGSYSVTQKALFPGCIFLRTVLNKELHDFIREYDGIGGFVGSKVGNTKRQINKPRPVSEDDMEAIFRQAKEEQEKADLAFEEEQKNEVLKSAILNIGLESDDGLKSEVDSKPKRRSRKTSDQTTDKSSTPKNSKLLVKGSTVRVLSGTFAGFVGTLQKLNRKTKIATVVFSLFGKENIVEIDVSEIAPETTDA